MINASADGSPVETALIDSARAVVRAHGDGDVHTVAAAILDEDGRTHVGLNLYHFTGGPCAELVALAVARAAGARAPRLMVAVGDDGRGVLAPCGRDRQVLADYFPDIRVIVPGANGTQVVPVGELLPHTYRWQAEQVQRLRFRATHLPAVRQGGKWATIRFEDPVQVGPALLVFEAVDAAPLRGRVTSTVARRLRDVTDEEARESGFTGAAAVLPGLRDRYPQLRPDDEIVLVRFEVDVTSTQAPG